MRLNNGEDLSQIDGTEIIAEKAGDGKKSRTTKRGGGGPVPTAVKVTLKTVSTESGDKPESQGVNKELPEGLSAYKDELAVLEDGRISASTKKGERLLSALGKIIPIKKGNTLSISDLVKPESQTLLVSKKNVIEKALAEKPKSPTKSKVEDLKPKRKSREEIIAEIEKENEEALRSYDEWNDLQVRRERNRYSTANAAVSAEEILVPAEEQEAPLVEKTVGPSIRIEDGDKRNARLEELLDKELEQVDAELSRINEGILEAKANQEEFEASIEYLTREILHARAVFRDKDTWKQEQSLDGELQNITSMSELLDSISRLEELSEEQKLLHLREETEIERLEAERAQLEDEKKKILSKAAMKRMGVEATKLEGDISYLVSMVNSALTTPGEVLDFLSHMALTKEEIEELSRLEGDEQKRLSGKTKQEKDLLNRVAERLRRALNLEYFLNNSEYANKSKAERLVIARRPEANLTNLLQMVGTAEDVEKIGVLIDRGRVIVASNGEIQAQDYLGEQLCNHFRAELIGRLESELTVEIKANLEAQALNDPLIEEVESMIKKLDSEVEKFDSDMDFEKRKGLGDKILSRLTKSNAFNAYLEGRKINEHKRQESAKLLELLNAYMQEKNEGIDELAKSMVETSNILSFDSLHFDMDALARSLSGAKTGVELQVYKTRAAKELVNSYGLREKIRERGLKKTPEVSVVSQEDLDRMISPERQAEIENFVKAELASKLTDIFRDFQVEAQEKKDDLTSRMLSSEEFKMLVSMYVEQENAASFIKEKFNPKEGFPARFIAENIGAIHNLELRKNEYKNRALAFVEKEIIDEKREASKQEAVRYAKEIFGGFMSSNADIKYETKLNEIILEGDSLIAQGIKLAETAVAGADLGVSKIEEVYYDISEGTSSEILRRVPDAAGYLDRLTTAKSRRAEAKSKVRAKKGILSGLWAAIVGGFGTNG